MAGADLNLAGAPASAWGAYTLERMTACGQTSTHLPHWMQRLSSQAGISSAMLRFSQRVVPLGYVPSGGSALTGSRSPSPAMMRAVTRCTNAGAEAGTGARTSYDELAVSGSVTSAS